MTDIDLREGPTVGPTEPDDPTDRLLADVAEIRLKGAGRDAVLLRLGGVMMPVGLVVAVVAWFLSHGTQNPLAQRDAVIAALIGLTTSVVGVGLFLRYSLAEFLRFWMARMIHQQDVATRALVEAARRDATDTETR